MKQFNCNRIYIQEKLQDSSWPFQLYVKNRLVSCFLETYSDSKNYVRFARSRNIRAWAYHKIGMCLALKNLRLHRQLEIFIELRQESSFKANEKMQFLWNSQAILKIIVDL